MYWIPLLVRSIQDLYIPGTRDEAETPVDGGIDGKGWGRGALGQEQTGSSIFLGSHRKCVGKNRLVIGSKYMNVPNTSTESFSQDIDTLLLCYSVPV